MNVRKIILFCLRLFFYFSVVSIIVIHPGISVSFDRIGIWQWFVIIPVQALIAFLPIRPLRRKFFVAALSLFALSVFATGFNMSVFLPFLTGFLSFGLAFLLFCYPRWGKLSALEPFFLAYICLRLLALSRSGEEIAGQSEMLTQFLLVWTAVVFLFHSAVVYLCLYPNSARGALREGALFFIAAAAVLFLVIAVLPPDFIRNSIIENLVPQRVPERIAENSDRGMPRETEGRNESRRTLPLSDGGQQPGLRGISEYEWQNRTGRGRSGQGGEDNRQYLVMVVVSETEPVYMGNSFRGLLDPVRGFLVSPNEPINRVAETRFFVTWFNNEANFDMARQNREVLSLSTLPRNYLPWRPVSVDPTILSTESGPLRYVHSVISGMHTDDPLRLIGRDSRSLTDSQRADLVSYLELPLEQMDLALLESWLNDALQYWRENREDLIRSNPYLRDLFSGVAGGFSLAQSIRPVNDHIETILAILIGFSTYQYNLSYDDDCTIEVIKNFLFNTKDGDCVEFSNSLALLGRIAGIPSRVVTGYLAAESLQTVAHLRGLAALRNQIPLLRQYPFNSLFMVTNLHSHSWTQFYIPGYGWLDFEATSFAIPPVGSGDFNTWDVVIPLIDQERTFSAVRKFPWRAVLRAAGILALAALACAYIVRYGREIFLFLGTQKGGREGARSLYLLLLARLAADGKPIKPASKTASEYAELFPRDLSRRNGGTEGIKENELSQRHGGTEGIKEEKGEDHFKEFASLYSQLRWREFEDKAKADECFNRLKDEYHNILKTTRRRGIGWAIVRIISLRGLAYL